VSWGVRDATGKVVRGPYSLGTLAAGTRTLVWNGRTSGGSRVPDGTYTPFVSTKAGSLRGYATRAVRVDTVAPALSVSGTVPSFYPVKDGYRDTAPYRSVVNEGGRLTLTVRTTGGKLVRTVVLTHSGAGTFTPSWNGRTASGALLASGGYRVTVTAQDAALNRRSSTAYGVTVSLKKLVAHTGSATVTPSASRFASDVGECSRVTSSPTWAGGLLYESNALGCWDGTEEDISDVVLTYHSYVLPTAVKYKDVWLSITSRSQTGDTALVFYLDTDDGIADGGLYQLPAQYGEYALDVTPLSTLQSGKVLRWGLGTGYGRTYEVRSFAVHFTYYRLE
jgi:flagellar hook assembly protein FlgD